MDLIRRHKAIARVVLCALATVVLCVCAVQIEKYTFHRRAVQLVDTVASLEVGSSTFVQARQALAQFESKEVSSDCNSTACNYTVDVYPRTLSVVVKRFSRVDEDDFRRRIYRMYVLAGGTVSSVRASVNIADGKVSSKYVTIAIVVPPDNREQFERERWVVGTSYVGPRRNHSVDRPDYDIRQELLHPDYLVRTGIIHPNLDTGGGYTALDIGAIILPSADPADIRRLSTFDLDCLTRWHPCTEAELMPSVSEQVKADGPRIYLAIHSLTCDTDFLDWLGKHAENIAEAECVGRRTDDFRDLHFEVLSARMKTQMKGLRHWSVGEISDLISFGGPAGIPRDSRLSAQSCIVYFKDVRYNPALPRLWLYPCGVLPATKENMARVQRSLTSASDGTK